MKKQDLMGVCTIFKLVIGLLILAILLISINIKKKKKKKKKKNMM